MRAKEGLRHCGDGRFFDFRGTENGIQDGSGRQDILNELERLSVRRTQEPVVSDFVKAIRENMLEKPADELHRSKGHLAWNPGIGFLVPEGNRCVSDVFDTIVGEGDAIYIGSKIP